MNGNSRELGVIRFIAPRAEIVDVRENNGLKWATFRVPVTHGDQTSLVQIADSREATVAAAQTALEVSDAFFKARGTAKKRALESERVRTLLEARAALNSDVADAMIERTVVGGGKREKINIALFPAEGEEPEQVLALIHTAISWQRYPFSGDERPISYTRKEKGIPCSYQLHTVLADDPVYLWSFDPDQPVLFRASLEGGLEARIYEEVETQRFSETIVSAEPAEEPAAEPTEPPADELPVKPGPVTPAAKKSNGNRVIACGQCDTENTVKKTAKTAHCTKCKAALDLTTN